MGLIWESGLWKGTFGNFWFWLSSQMQESRKMHMEKVTTCLQCIMSTFTYRKATVSAGQMDLGFVVDKWISGLCVLLGSWTVHITEKSICYPDVVRVLAELLRGWKNRYRILIWFLPPLVMDSSFIFLVTWYWLHVLNPKSPHWVIHRGQCINCRVNNFKEMLLI